MTDVSPSPQPLASPFMADTDPNLTFAGVGRVISEWEGIEVGLCRIFSFLVGDPDGEAMRKYGEPHFFGARFVLLNQAADKFFINRPCQELEGLLHLLGKDILRYSDRRNEVAHGIVMPLNAFSFAKRSISNMRPRTNYWALLPAYYQLRRHGSDGLPDYVYDSRALNQIAGEMATLYSAISGFRERLRYVI